MRAAKGTKNDVKDEFIASLEDNAYFNWVKNSDPDAADELLEYLKEQNLANLKDATIEAYVRPYKKLLMMHLMPTEKHFGQKKKLRLT